MSYNSRPASSSRSSKFGNSRSRGDRPSRKERGFCTHGVPIGRCKKQHNGAVTKVDDGSGMAGGAMA